MAKEDFCYTHYDGDEARDLAHMNRLERGAYTDLRLAQRKFGRLSLDRIKKILSKDFDNVWDSLECILIKDEEGFYYIDWLERSVEKMRLHSKKQKDNVSKRLDKQNKDLDEPDVSLDEPNLHLDEPKTNSDDPLEDGDGNGDLIQAISNSKVNKRSAKPEIEEPLPHGENFAKAWKDWIDYRKERRLSKYTSIGIRRLFKELSTYSEDVCIACINKSIKSNWQGLFPDKITQQDLTIQIPKSIQEDTSGRWHPNMKNPWAQ